MTIITELPEETAPERRGAVKDSASAQSFTRTTGMQNGNPEGKAFP